VTGRSDHWGDSFRVTADREKAILFAVNDGLVVQMNDGRYGITWRDRR
jgi:hypothetical protein